MSSPAPQGDAFAAAKVNLFLHVGPLGEDGYHPISSLIVFADVGDRLSLRDGATLVIEGPFAAELSSGADNLVARACDALGISPGLALDKNLPLAAGLGGGSADAAATLRLLNPLSPQPRNPAALAEIAARLGADVPMCLESRPVIAEGRGDELIPAPQLPILNGVLVNPGVASPTGAVYRAFDDLRAEAGADRPLMAEVYATAADLVGLLQQTRNDLEAPAVALAPAIAETLDALRTAPETLFARMSGSGATCFALCADGRDAAGLAARISSLKPGWWIRSCRLAV